MDVWMNGFSIFGIRNYGPDVAAYLEKSMSPLFPWWLKLNWPLGHISACLQAQAGTASAYRRLPESQLDPRETPSIPGNDQTARNK